MALQPFLHLQSLDLGLSPIPKDDEQLVHYLSKACPSTCSFRGSLPRWTEDAASISEQYDRTHTWIGRYESIGKAASQIAKGREEERKACSKRIDNLRLDWMSCRVDKNELEWAAKAREAELKRRIDELEVKVSELEAAQASSERKILPLRCSARRKSTIC